MNRINKIGRRSLSAAIVGALALSLAATAVSTSAAAQAPPSGYRPTREVFLSIGEGELISLPRNVTNIWTSNSDVADVHVNNPRQIGLFGRANGESTVIATAADGSVVYGAHVRVSQNISSVNEVLRQAMPGSDITVTHVGQVAVINGTVASPEDSEQAELLVRTVLNPGISPASTEGLRILPVNRLRVATPQQVMLQVRIVEVNRSFSRSVGVNLASFDPTSGFVGGIAQGRLPGPQYTPGGPLFTGVTAGSAGTSVITGQSPGTTLGLAGRLFGLDLLSAVDLAENNGLATTLAQPSLTALSGETASFLAGGEFPIPISQSLGSVSIEYKSYGVGLAFTPTVLENGRISLRVRPEVSELSSEGSVRFNGFVVPALTTRRAETTVELGSGQSFMIGGLLRNVNNTTIDRAPGLGSLPIIGALFRSTSFRRAETELVIIVTPYLVQPVNANQIALPTDGYRSANDGERMLLGQEHAGRSGEPRPEPQAAPAVRPGIEPGGGAAAVVPAPAQPSRQQTAVGASRPQRAASGVAQPGFDLR